jgi:hypothetical protein
MAHINNDKNNRIILISCVIAIGTFIFPGIAFGQNENLIQMVFTSDAHFGITRHQFRGDTAVPGKMVNAAMVAQINKLPGLTLPDDGGVNGGQITGGIDYLVEGGDITNRMEGGVQSAATSWDQFKTVYLNGIELTGHNQQPAKVLMVPGNHDISNAVGFPRPLKPLTDATSMVQIYNLMLKPDVPMTNEAYDYTKSKINYSFNIKGIHLMFITLWPDSAERIWMQKDLDSVAINTPVIIFTHDQPECETKHFTNPAPPFDINGKSNFQNLVSEHYKEGLIVPENDGETAIEQRGVVKFLKMHPNIKAYFHGNSNWNEFYSYNGPDNDVKLNTFRVDSPMKGRYSGKDETLLSFQLISLDAQSQTLTVRECLWNTKPTDPDQKIVFGKSSTVSLKIH